MNAAARRDRRDTGLLFLGAFVVLALLGSSLESAVGTAAALAALFRKGG